MKKKEYSFFQYWIVGTVPILLVTVLFFLYCFFLSNIVLFLLIVLLSVLLLLGPSFFGLVLIELGQDLGLLK